jgi:hypothetical protein
MFTQINSNSAIQGAGGGAYVWSSDLQAYGTTVSKNNGQSGGGIYVNNSTAIINNCNESSYK